MGLLRLGLSDRAPRVALLGGTFLVMLVLPLGLSPFLIEFVTGMMIYGILVLGLDIVWGYAGILMLGQAVYFGWGAYTAAVLAKYAGITSVFIVLPASMVVGGLLCLGLGAFLFLGSSMKRLPDIFVAMSTFVLAYASQRLAASWTDIGAYNGIAAIPPLTIGDVVLKPGLPMYFFVVVLLFVVYLLLRSLVHSQFGLVLVASKDNDHRVTFLGYSVAKFRLVAFAVNGVVAALAGALYASNNAFVGPTFLGYVFSLVIVLWLLLGGSMSLIGGLIGVLVYQVAALQLSDQFPVLWPVMVGAALVVIITAVPQGLYGLLVPERLRRLRFSQQRRGSVEAGPSSAVEPEPAP